MCAFRTKHSSIFKSRFCPHRKASESNSTSHRGITLPTKRSEKATDICERTIHRTSNLRETKLARPKTLVRPHHPSIGPCQNYSARQCTGWKKKRQTKKKMGWQHL
ncbi:hypothetical protein PoB_004182800 [Plakobranchus ocellatus]|uniref:Uncharacterized protein n=1 Tax=Plakobranchus ocellatus TaxID=259542 RepID=A0AAV4B6T7_9GAST|nr:hypothetical protein PoB_004182800 [Plakobranchus ocellatus]